MPSRLALLALVLALPSCGPDSSGTESTGDTTAEATGTTGGTTGTPTTGTPTTGGTTDASSSGSSTGALMPDPSYSRACQPDDFVCKDPGCLSPQLGYGECYKPCTPTVIGGVDDECDEPERPYCSQVGLMEGGDWDCNGCAHVCTAVPDDHCQYGVDECSVKK